MDLSDNKIEKLIKPEMIPMWEMNRETDCRDDFRANEHYIFVSETVVGSIGNSIKGYLDFSKKNLVVLRWLLFVLWLIAALMKGRK